MRKRAAEAARKKAKEEANRALYLDHLAKRENAVWKQVDAYIQKRQPNDYDRAVILLTDLHDLAVRQGDEDWIPVDNGGASQDPCSQGQLSAQADKGEAIAGDR